MYKFWRIIKNEKKCDKEGPYKQLLTNDIFNKDYNKIKKIELTQTQKVEELLKFNKLPKWKDKFSDSTGMYDFWYKIKKDKKCDEEGPYKQLLTNDIFNKNYNKIKKIK